MYFLSHDFHCFVLLYIHSLRAAYIADGGNLFRERQEVANQIKNIVQLRLISLSYDQQSRVDHCATSAVIIGMEMLRMQANGMRLKKLIGNKSMRMRISRAFHNAYSQPLEVLPLTNFAMRLICETCKRTFRADQRTSLSRHIRNNHSQ